MDSPNRLLSFLFLGAITAALNACASSPVQECGATGVFCPAGTHCAAAQGICIPNTNKCGDAHIDVDLGEVCDDGNTVDGDGCSADCKSDETCGNDTIDMKAGEVCDDRNTLDGDGCSANCRSNESCGNGTVDKSKNEVCDDGNHVDGDGCDNNCRPTGCGNGLQSPGEACDDGNDINGDGCDNNCRPTACGNSFVSPGEVCDDGNIISGDGCSLDCKSAEVCGNGIKDVRELCDDGLTPGGCNDDCQGGTGCGDNSIDKDAMGHPLEQCDDGNADNTDDCLSSHEANHPETNCKLAQCGDGVTQLSGSRLEDCDRGFIVIDTNGIPKATAVEDATCNIDCTKAQCGDGKVNVHFKPDMKHFEQCDDRNQVNDDGCDNNCTFTGCGNGIMDSNEQCDDGNLIDNDGCDSNCKMPTCGNGVINPGETCDDGNIADGDGCDRNCKPTSCGNGITTVGEQCDDSNINPGDGCSPTCRNEVCRNGILDPGEQCDDGNNTQTDGCLDNCRLPLCGDGAIHQNVEECDDSNTRNGDGCSSTCRNETCGNAILDPGEECDKGLMNDDSGDCRTDCILNRCGDGYINMTGTHKEDCEGVNPVDHDSHTVTPTETATCNINCTTPRCGDGIANHHFVPTDPMSGVLAPNPEQCDDGARSNGDGCSVTCQFERCGNGIVDPGEQCDGSAGLQPCSPTCFQQQCGNAIVDPDEECDNGMMNSDISDCRSDCVINRCGDGHPNTMGSHRESCDEGPVAGIGDRTAIPTNTLSCNSNCSTARCGDSIVNPKFIVMMGTMLTEQCDPPGNGCSAICRLENCGNGIKDPGEQCDDGNGREGDICENDCTLPRCGNGIPDRDEECDDGSANGTAGSMNGCDLFCHFNKCGNGFLDIDEECDPGTGTPVTDSRTCNSDCTIARCGDGHTNAAMVPPENCDQGSLNGNACPYGQPDCMRCNSTCSALESPGGAFCGNGHKDTQFGEQCDPGGGTNSSGVPTPVDTLTCDLDCSIVTCGDRHINLAASEVCDDGNADQCGTCDLSCHQTVTLLQATGSITAIDGNSISDGDTFTLDDGFHRKLVFEFDTGSQIAGDVPVPFKRSDVAIAIGAAIAAAITGEKSRLDIKAVFDDTTNIVSLTNNHKSSLGNQPILTSNANLPHQGMTGGAGANCPTDTGCATNSDCASSSCNQTTHKCQ